MPTTPTAIASRARPAPWALPVTALIFVAYGFGLTRDLTETWSGLHDWNGAMNSQYARNLLRYPLSVHGGMGLVAVGDAIPPPNERARYANHPPGLVWILAAAFSVCGQAEWVARLTSVVASMGSLLLLLDLARRRYGPVIACLAGALYAVMPMSVYFGRMVSHEPHMLFLMLAALWAWRTWQEQAASPRRRTLAAASWAVFVICSIWVDWPGMIFAALFCVHATIQRLRGRIGLGSFLMVFLVGATAAIGVLGFVVTVGLAGRWSDFFVLFRSRTGALSEPMSTSTLSYTFQNLTAPVILLTAVGLAVDSWRCLRGARPVVPEAGRSDRDLDVLWVLHATGLIWLCLFWRQYQLHAFAAFYLGPWVSLLWARGVLALHDGVRSFWKPAAIGICGALAALCPEFCIVGTADYYAEVSWPVSEIEAWRAMRGKTPAGGRVVLPVNPVVVEQYGGYRSMTIVPPQLAYYLDTPLGVFGDEAGSSSRPSDAEDDGNSNSGNK